VDHLLCRVIQQVLVKLVWVKMAEQELTAEAVALLAEAEDRQQSVQTVQEQLAAMVEQEQILGLG
jgi:hypothetical protein